MKRTELLQEIRIMSFEEKPTIPIYSGGSCPSFGGLTDRTFRRYLAKYKEHGLKGLIDKRLEQVSHKRGTHRIN